MWSPSQTNLWLECPLKWSNRRQGIPEELGRWHPAQLAGTALHAGWGVYLDPTQPEKSLPGAATALSACLLDGWPSATGPVSTGYWTFDLVESQALKCLAKVCKDTIPDLLGDNGMVLAAECQLGDGSKESGQYPGTADLITQHGDGDKYLVVSDYKSHWTVRSTERYLSETVRSWQLHQYAYFAQIKFGLPVKYIRSVHIQVTPNPKAWVYPVAVMQKRLDTWKEYADRVWLEMRDQAAYQDLDGVELAWPNWSACEKYGAAYRCGYYAKCHEEGT